MFSDDNCWRKVETFAVAAMLTGVDDESCSSLVFAKALGKPHGKLLADIRRDFAPAGLYNPSTKEFSEHITLVQSANGMTKELLLPPDIVIFLMVMQAHSYRRHLVIQQAFSNAKEQLSDEDYSALKTKLRS